MSAVGSVFGSLFGGLGKALLGTPDIKLPPAPPPPPTVDDARQAAESRDQMLRRRGRGASILTGPEGVGTPASTSKTTLIGS
jgi:hypothetical protein